MFQGLHKLRKIRYKWSIDENSETVFRTIEFFEREATSNIKEQSKILQRMLTLVHQYYLKMSSQEHITEVDNPVAITLKSPIQIK